MSKSTKKSLPSQVLYFWPEKIERKKENSISDRDKCLDKISNGSKCTLSDILDRWSSQGKDKTALNEKNIEMKITRWKLEPTYTEQESP